MKKILAIDDQQDNLITYKAILKSNFPDCNLFTALSGKEGIEIAKNEQPDVILLDIIMPMMDGYEVCKKLKGDALTKNIPIIMVTAIKTDSDSRIKGLNLGADAFLSKPIDASELSAQIKVMLRIKQAEDKLRSENENLESLVEERTNKIKESEEKYLNIYRNTPVMLHSVDANGYLISVSNYWLEKMGYNWDEVIGKKSIDFLTASSKKYAIEVAFPAFYKYGERFDVPYQFVTKKGKILDVLLSAISEKDDEGNLIRSLAVITDITDRKKAGVKLQQSQAALIEAQTIAAVGSWEWDILKDEFMFSDEWCRIHGLPINVHLTNEELLLIAHDDDKERIAIAFKNALDGTSPYNIEHRIIKQNDKETRTVKANAECFLDEAGKPIRMIGTAQDITERKLAEDKLKESEKRFEDLVEMLPEAVFEMDVNFNLTYVNQRSLELFGLDEKDFEKGLNALQLIAKDDHKRAKTNFSNRIQGDTPGMIEYQAVRKDGSEFPILFHANSIIEDGLFAGIRGIVINISELKSSEDKIRKLSTAVEQSPSVIVITDLKGNVEYVNPRFTDLTGYTSDEVIGNKSNILKSGEQSIEFYAEIWGLLSSGKEWRGEFHNKKKNGALYWESASISPIFNKQGEITNYIKVAEDITKQRNSEKIIKESEKKYRTIIENSNDMIWMLDVKGHFTFLNKQAEKASGYSIENLKGNSFIPLVLDEELPFLNDVLTRTMRGESITYEMNLKTVHRNLLTLSVNTAPLYDGDEVIGMLSFARDITEQKKSEKELKESELRFKTLHNASFGGIAIHDQGIIKDCNQGLVNISGYTSEELIGENGIKLLIAEESQEIVMNNIKASYEKAYEVIGIRKNGEEYPLRIEAREIPFEGKQLRVVEFRDITEQKKAEKTLSDSEERYQNFISQSQEGIYRLEVNEPLDVSLPIDRQIMHINKYASYAECNDAFIKMYKAKSKEDIINKRLGEFHDRKDDSKSDENIRRFIESGYKISNAESYELLKDGKMKWFSNHTIGIIENGKLVRIWGTQLDITARKRAEQIQKVILEIAKFSTENTDLKIFLEKTHLEIKSILNANNFYVALYNKTNDTYTFPYFIDEKESYEGDEPERLKDSLTDLVRRTGKGQIITEEIEEKIREKQNLALIGFSSPVWLGVPLFSTSKNEVIGVIVIQDYNNKDTYSTKDLEILEIIAFNIGVFIERLQNINDLTLALVKATESDRLKSAFLATMSHELRTPLNAIIGFSDIINEELSMEDIVSFNKHINSSGQHLLSIVEDLFDITLIESGETKINKKEENLNLIFSEVHEIIKAEQQAIHKNDIDLLMDIPDGLSNLRINTDASKFKQILINLLKNALKFTHEGYVKYGFNILMKNQRSFLKFYVEDTGIGIPKEKQELIFDVFRQVEDSNTRLYGGTGIGLSISKKLTELLGGEIWIASEKEKGSVFYFTIPFDEEMSKDEIIESNQKANITNLEHNKMINKKILIVEDVEESYELLKIHISNLGFKTIWAENGEVAVKYCKDNDDITLVLMDLNMPVMNGYDATKEIKKDKPNLPIIAQTAYAVAGDRERILALGFDDYISKPIKKEKLLTKIEALLNR